ncbi:M64 family metallopeptidase [Streptomyces sp. NPDC012888]|uniref:M64 family metallopeptidase n=1 Tax=Streptomyces sp. NPDC012888 TaxID=3364855 RepID=UPI0036BE7129
MKSPTIRPVLRAGVAAACTAALLLATGQAGASGPAARAGTARASTQVEVEVPGPERGGDAGSGHVLVPSSGAAGARAGRGLTAAERAADGRVGALVENGPAADRLDVVVIGDGYTAGELDRFRADAQRKWAEIAAVEPYATYRELFNVWTVDAVSAESGVSGDPDPATVRDTALGSYFWCADIERLLCVDQEKVDAYAAKAPEADLVLVLANSAKYGGAGYNEPSDTLGYAGISTASAGHPKSGQVAVHETGHSLGKLADEYFYTGVPEYAQYTGREPADLNSSTLTADRMARQRAKWHRWLGEESPDGGTVGAYEGGGYYVTGLHRPTPDSAMRSLGKPFNLPGVEAMIAGFYQHARIATPLTPTGTPLRGGDTARVAVPRLAGADGRQPVVRWYLDGWELWWLRGRTEARVGHLWTADRGLHRLSVTAEDRTPSVRDPHISRTLRSTVTWEIRP